MTGAPKGRPSVADAVVSTSFDMTARSPMRVTEPGNPLFGPVTGIATPKLFIAVPYLPFVFGIG